MSDRNRTTNHPEAQCLGKSPFDSRDKADKALRSHRKPRDLHVYRCGHCKHWHIGSSRDIKPKEWFKK